VPREPWAIAGRAKPCLNQSSRHLSPFASNSPPSACLPSSFARALPRPPSLCLAMPLFSSLPHISLYLSRSSVLVSAVSLNICPRIRESIRWRVIPRTIDIWPIRDASFHRLCPRAILDISRVFTHYLSSHQHSIVPKSLSNPPSPSRVPSVTRTTTPDSPGHSSANQQALSVHPLLILSCLSPTQGHLPSPPPYLHSETIFAS
jgi:hypothetical protein